MHICICIHVHTHMAIYQACGLLITLDDCQTYPLPNGALTSKPHKRGSNTNFVGSDWRPSAIHQNSWPRSGALLLSTKVPGIGLAPAAIHQKFVA